MNQNQTESKQQDVEKLRLALKDATELFGEIMRDEVNHQDEAEKWLRAYGEICPANAGCTASAMGWAIKYANIHELALRLVQAKGRFHTQKAFEDLREFISSENAIGHAPGVNGKANE